MRVWVVYLGCYIGLVLAAAVSKSDAFERWKNPRHYWSEEIRVQSELLADYKRQVAECRLELAKIGTPEAARIWVMQKDLEGYTREEALDDYRISLDSSKTACQAIAILEKYTNEDLSEAKRQLAKVSD